MISRPHFFLLFVLLSFFNPFTLFWFQISLTFVIVVPMTLVIWFIARWQEIVDIEDESNRFEMFFGCGIYALNLARNAFNFNEKPMFGLFDMLVAFLSVCVAFYGFKGFKHFVLPTAYLSILIVGYQLEFAITQVVFLENSLAHFIASTLNLLTINASANGNLVTIHARDGTFQTLMIDAPCTGIKGMLAYGSLAVLMILDVKASPKRKALCTAIGAIGTFLVNLLRLLTIFLACYFLGIEAAMAVHIYLGYGLFIIWVFLFWFLAFKYLLTPTE